MEGNVGVLTATSPHSSTKFGGSFLHCRWQQETDDGVIRTIKQAGRSVFDSPNTLLAGVLVSYRKTCLHRVLEQTGYGIIFAGKLWYEVTKLRSPVVMFYKTFNFLRFEWYLCKYLLTSTTLSYPFTLILWFLSV